MGEAGSAAGTEPSEGWIADRLLRYLRGLLADDTLGWAEPPARLRGGFETLIHRFRLSGARDPFAGSLVLRLFREPRDAERARFEAAVQNAVAAQGYPAPRVLHANPGAEPLGAPFLVMEHVPGRNLLAHPLDPTLLRIPGILASLQLRLHALDPSRVLEAIERAGLPREAVTLDVQLAFARQRIAALGLEGLRPAIAWLDAHRPEPGPSVVCHGDLHPLNVLMDGGRVSGVIDWTLLHVRIADPAYDVGTTAALLFHGPVSVPGFLQDAVDLVRRRLVRAYRDRYLRARPLDPSAVAWYDALRSLFFLLEAGEHRLADLGEIERPAKPTAFGTPRIVDGVVRRFRAATGVSAALPGDSHAGL